MQLVIAITALHIAVESVVMKFTSIVVALRAKRHITTRGTAFLSKRNNVLQKRQENRNHTNQRNISNITSK
jgi:hypothetical protein